MKRLMLSFNISDPGRIKSNRFRFDPENLLKLLRFWCKTSSEQFPADIIWFDGDENKKKVHRLINLPKSFFMFFRKLTVKAEKQFFMSRLGSCPIRKKQKAENGPSWEMLHEKVHDFYRVFSFDIIIHLRYQLIMLLFI